MTAQHIEGCASRWQRIRVYSSLVVCVNCAFAGWRGSDMRDVFRARDSEASYLAPCRRGHRYRFRSELRMRAWCCVEPRPEGSVFHCILGCALTRSRRKRRSNRRRREWRRRRKRRMRTRRKHNNTLSYSYHHNDCNTYHSYHYDHHYHNYYYHYDYHDQCK